MTTEHHSSKSLLADIREVLRRRYYSIHTERAYCDWIVRFVRFHDLTSREQLFEQPEVRVEKFLGYLAMHRNVAASTQNQAFNALMFLYGKVLKHPLEGISAVRSRKEPRIPVVLTRDEIRQLLSLITGAALLPVKLLYGCGLRITEAIRLRVLDIDFGYHEITVRDGKGMKDRVTPLPDNTLPLLKNHLERVKTIHQKDLLKGYGAVYLPFALARKYPNAAQEWNWQYVFPARKLSQPEFDAGLIAYTYQEKKPSLEINRDDINALPALL